MDRLLKKIEALRNSDNKLLLIIGQPGSGKSRLIQEYSDQTGIPIINFNKIFGEKPNDNIDIVKTMNEFMKTYDKDILLLDNKRVLYDQDSKIDLLSFLKDLAKDKIVIATWNGKIEDGQLVHIRSKAPSDLIYSVEGEEINYILC